MSAIRNVVLIGLGAIGTLYASVLSRAPDISFRVWVDEARKKKYQTTPPVWNGVPLDLRYATAVHPGKPADIVLIAVKSPDLAAAIDAIAPIVGPDTCILPLLNGITSERQVAARYGADRTLFAYHIGPTAMRESNIVRGGIGTLVFGGETNTPPDEQVVRIQKFWESTGIPYETPGDMKAALWGKFILNSGLNQASALLRAPHGWFQKNPSAMNLVVDLMNEVAAVARAEGISGVDDLLAQSIAYIPQLPPEAKTSMLQDVEAGRPTEIDLFAGTLIPLARKHDMAVPLHDMCARLIPALPSSCG